MRLIFVTAPEFFNWLKTRKLKYQIYRTETEVIAIPTTSTRPTIIGYYEAISEEDYEIVRDLLKTFDIEVFHVLKVEWDIEKQLGR